MGVLPHIVVTTPSGSCYAVTLEWEYVVQCEVQTDVIDDIGPLGLETIEEIIGNLGSESLVESG